MTRADPDVVAVKQANDDLEQARKIVDLGLALYAGDDNLVQAFLEVGGYGGVCVHTHLVGPQVKEQVRAFKEGDAERSRNIERESSTRPTRSSRSSRIRSRSSAR